MLCSCDMQYVQCVPPPAVLALSAEDSETQLRWLKVFADNDIEILPSEEVR